MKRPCIALIKTSAARPADPELWRALYHPTSQFDMRKLVDAAVRRRVSRKCCFTVLPMRQVDQVVVNWVSMIIGGTRQIIQSKDAAERLPTFRSQVLSNEPGLPRNND
jgi:hypothetical protein